MTTIDKLHKPTVFRIDEANLLAEHLNESETGQLLPGPTKLNRVDYADPDSEIWIYEGTQLRRNNNAYSDCEIWAYKVVWISEDDAQILCIDEHGIELGYL